MSHHRNYRIEGDCSIHPNVEELCSRAESSLEEWEEIDVKCENNKLKFCFYIKTEEIKEIDIKFKKRHDKYYVDYEIIYKENHC